MSYNLRLDEFYREYYNHPKGFTVALEEQDPSSDYIGTKLEGLDAFERQLYRFNIKVKEPYSDNISKFFECSDSAKLFPEFIKRSVENGIEEYINSHKIAAVHTKIDNYDYRGIHSVYDNEIAINSNLTQFNHSKKILGCAYEAIKYQKIHLFSIALKQIGINIAREQIHRGIASIQNSLDCFLNNISAYDILYPYNPNLFITSSYEIAKKYSCKNDDNIIVDFDLTTKDMEENLIVFDSDNALEYVSKGVEIDFENIINKNLETAYVSLYGGINLLNEQAAAIINVN